MDKMTLGKRLKEARLGRGLTQQRLAEKASIGNVYLGEVERGLKMPSLNSFIKLVEALDTSADLILRDEVSAGQEYVYHEITEKLRDLTPKQRKTAGDILDGYLRNLDRDDGALKPSSED